MRGGGSRDRRSYGTSRGRGGGQYSDGDDERRGGGWGGGRGGGNSWSRTTRSSRGDWLISDRRSSRSPYYGNNGRSFGGACFTCGQSGHRASECPKKQGY